MEFSGFDWDVANEGKCQRHGISIGEIESVFRGAVVILPDADHSRAERRFRAIGRTSQGRLTFVVFTQRGQGADIKVRPMSARFKHRKEAASYEEDDPDL